jgi:hypothetical protein
MISGECFTDGWQAHKRAELGGCDPVLLEKTIHALALLDALAGRGLEFVFKGGTSLLLRLPRIRRLSIDADILCQEAPKKLDRLLAEIARTAPFTRFTEDDRGPDRVPARRHFKFHYTPLDPRNPAPFVLLDVVHAQNLYPVIEEVPLPPAFVEGEGTLPVPTIEGLLGDKLPGRKTRCKSFGQLLDPGHGKSSRSLRGLLLPTSRKELNFGIRWID